MPASVPFHEVPKVIMSPHVSNWTDGMFQARAKIIAENKELFARVPAR